MEINLLGQHVGPYTPANFFAAAIRFHCLLCGITQNPLKRGKEDPRASTHPQMHTLTIISCARLRNWLWISVISAH